ncbi:MAG: DNA alkylation repair protein [DPANN group archaeon]|nr:DNA alkylation repair protein [DPANN group archaeon]
MFIGITVPNLRKIAKKYKDISLDETKLLLSSKIHEHRLIALFILIIKYRVSDEPNKKDIFDIYLDNMQYINNWDLIDSSAGYIIGDCFKLSKSCCIVFFLGL